MNSILRAIRHAWQRRRKAKEPCLRRSKSGQWYVHDLATGLEQRASGLKALLFMTKNEEK